MLAPSDPSPLPNFAATHCRVCAMGWTRIGEKGGILTVCLLDREPVLAGMTDCDQFEPKEREAKQA
jgi:hypothetical protein